MNATDKKDLASTGGQTAAVTFEEGIQRLELLVRQLERGELTLEQSLACFEEGIGLVKQCQTQLERTAEKIQILTGEKQEQE